MSLSDSPFTNRLNTNYVPSHSEILEIRSLLVDPLEEIARIDAQIAEMELAEAHIPQDILLEIFFACLPSEHNAVIDSAEAPLLLGRVNRHWRSVAYATPMLWSSMHIPTLDTPPDIISGLERTVEAWVERSATCPLSVSLSNLTSRRRVGFDHTSKEYSLVLQILGVSRRLRYLTLDADADLIGPILEFGAENFPVLKSIRMNVPNQTIPENFFKIPSLEDVAFFSDAAALAFIKARIAMPTPLQRFHAEFNRSMEFDVTPELRSFILDGLQVAIHYSELRRRFTARDGLEQPGLFH
ncbi:hypothetical protein C8R45DRAFT_1208220 [Mycena sanguinolenta]|nr:hypothetical protein C8R45DRAFT_1208220 [Mycena sanguinolenta]